MYGAAGDADGRVVLLRAVDAVRRTVIGDDRVELRGRLVVHRAPRAAAVERHRGAAVAAVHHPLRILRIDPQIVVIAVRRLDVRVGLAAVGGLVEVLGAERVHRVRVDRVGEDVAVVVLTRRHVEVVVQQLPRPSGIVRPVDATLRVCFDRRPHALLREAQVLERELPGELDRALLEVVAEREVAEHLEEGGVPLGRAHVVEVVVLAARAHHLLRGRRARRRWLLAEEVVPERLHPGDREQRRGVVRRRDQRARRQPQVALRLEVGEKALAQLGRGLHVRESR